LKKNKPPKAPHFNVIYFFQLLIPFFKTFPFLPLQTCKQSLMRLLSLLQSFHFWNPKNGKLVVIVGMESDSSTTYLSAMHLSSVFLAAILLNLDSCSSFLFSLMLEIVLIRHLISWAGHTFFSSFLSFFDFEEDPTNRLLSTSSVYSYRTLFLPNPNRLVFCPLSLSWWRRESFTSWCS